jgi:hypothetical protein
MDRKKTLRYLQTRRFTGRRGLTPIKTKQKRTIPKTRSHRVETKPYVPLREYTGSFESRERQATDKEKHCEDPKWEGDQISCLDGEWQNKEECEKTQSEGNTENSAESIHPGPIQAVSTLHPESADDQTGYKNEIESEVIP